MKNLKWHDILFWLIIILVIIISIYNIGYGQIFAQQQPKQSYQQSVSYNKPQFGYAYVSTNDNGNYVDITVEIYNNSNWSGTVICNFNGGKGYKSQQIQRTLSFSPHSSNIVSMRFDVIGNLPFSMSGTAWEGQSAYLLENFRRNSI